MNISDIAVWALLIGVTVTVAFYIGSKTEQLYSAPYYLIGTIISTDKEKDGKRTITVSFKDGKWIVIDGEILDNALIFNKLIVNMQLRIRYQDIYMRCNCFSNNLKKLDPRILSIHFLNASQIGRVNFAKDTDPRLAKFLENR